MKIVEQLALIEARHESTEYEAPRQAQLEAMKRKQFEMEEQMRQFMQLQRSVNHEFGGNGGVGG